ncbi:Pol [Symbiodinium natans]|uniref:Pol protein n=1 Tax=Symbiodinium natans TaxID=878477 RepID=A0A812P2G8_9DINO|nr:Pol [Symbiodinium natans]
MFLTAVLVLFGSLPAGHQDPAALRAGPISSAVAVAAVTPVGAVTLLILVASAIFGAVHRAETWGQVLDFRDVRHSNLGGRGPDEGTPELVYADVASAAAGKVDLVVQASRDYRAHSTRDNGVEGHLGRISLRPSEEAHFNFSFRHSEDRVPMQRFFFTVYLSSAGERVRVSGFTRLCWDLDAKFERQSRHSGQDVLLEAPPDMEPLMPGDLEGLTERRHAATFFFESADLFNVSVFTEGDGQASVDFLFSGQNVVADLCEDADSGTGLGTYVGAWLCPELAFVIKQSPTQLLSPAMALPMRTAMKKAMKGSAMKAKAMKKPMKAMKKKTVSKIATGKRAKSVVFRGNKEKTTGGLQKSNLMLNKRGKVVSKKMHAKGKSIQKFVQNWLNAVMTARKELGIKGFCAVGGKSAQGKALYAKAKAIYAA